MGREDVVGAGVIPVSTRRSPGRPVTVGQEVNFYTNTKAVAPSIATAYRADGGSRESGRPN